MPHRYRPQTSVLKSVWDERQRHAVISASEGEFNHLSSSDVCIEHVSKNMASDSDCDSLAEPVPKKTKFSGAFVYKTKFSEEWKKTWPFVSSVAGDPHSFRCNICAKTLKCGHQGAADVKDHIAAQGHRKLAKTLATQPKLTWPFANPLRDKVRPQYNSS